MTSPSSLIILPTTINVRVSSFLPSPMETFWIYLFQLLQECQEFRLTLSWWRSLSYRNQSTDLLRKSMDWFLYDNDLSHKRAKSSFFRDSANSAFWFWLYNSEKKYRSRGNFSFLSQFQQFLHYIDFRNLR